MMDAYTKVELPIALVGGGLGYIGAQSIADGYKNKDTTNQTKAKQYAKFLAEANEPTQVALIQRLKKIQKNQPKKINKDKEIKMAEVLNLDTNKLISDYKQIEASIVSENSIFDKAIKYLNDSFNDKTLAPGC